ncbi:hypothetical protein QBC40DRAFT_266050 [Triangularia verruculosa]|uniref:Uncharacterized protein n=1 Tax=Triangularia verruculosa TaxID=2587418 RepID=A0AAN6XH72_9PEZI|nr:hypothetical protein QBC40DRAFT_266050 [Triangularia verruculosa]
MDYNEKIEPKVKTETPVGMPTKKRARNMMDSDVKTPTSSTGATPRGTTNGMYANAVFGTPSTVGHTTPFNRAVSVPGGQQPVVSPFNLAVSQDVANVRGELLKALPHYKNIYAAIESQPEVRSRLDVLHYLGVNIHHPHMARTGGLGSLLSIWDQLAGYSGQQIRKLNNENSILKIESANVQNENTKLKSENIDLRNENANLHKRIAELENSFAQSKTEIAGNQGNRGVDEPVRFDGSEPGKYVRYFNFMLWKRAITRAWSDRPDEFKSEKDKICYMLFCLDGDAFWYIADAANRIINGGEQGNDVWELKTGEDFLGHLARKYGKCE